MPAIVEASPSEIPVASIAPTWWTWIATRPAIAAELARSQRRTSGVRRAEPTSPNPCMSEVDAGAASTSRSPRTQIRAGTVHTIMKPTIARIADRHPHASTNRPASGKAIGEANPPITVSHVYARGRSASVVMRAVTAIVAL